MQIPLDKLSMGNKCGSPKNATQSSFFLYKQACLVARNIGLGLERDQPGAPSLIRLLLL